MSPGVPHLKVQLLPQVGLFLQVPSELLSQEPGPETSAEGEKQVEMEGSTRERSLGHQAEPPQLFVSDLNLTDPWPRPRLLEPPRCHASPASFTLW